MGKASECEDAKNYKLTAHQHRQFYLLPFQVGDRVKFEAVRQIFNK